MNEFRASPQEQPRVLNLPPSAFLLLAQLLLLVFYAIFDGSDSQRAVVSAINIMVLVLVIWVVNHSPAITWLTWVLAFPAFILSLLSAFMLNAAFSTWSSLLEAVLYFYAAGSQIVYMLGDEKVTTDELFSIGATYTLLAWGFAYAYLVCQAWVPGSFISGVIQARPLTFVEFLSLSFSNLSATGLSDILPVTAWARVLIILEQTVGVGYVAIVVSRLVSLTTQKRGQRRA